MNCGAGCIGKMPAKTSRSIIATRARWGQAPGATSHRGGRGRRIWCSCPKPRGILPDSVYRDGNTDTFGLNQQEEHMRTLNAAELAQVSGGGELSNDEAGTLVLALGALGGPATLVLAIPVAATLYLMD